MKDGHHINTFIVPIYQHGVLGEAPEEYYVNATDANGNTMAIKVDPDQSDVLPDIQFTRTVPFLGGIAATAGAEAVAGSTATGTGISVTTAATTGGAVLVVGAAAAYSYDQRAAPAYDSEHVAGYRSLTIPATEYVETYQPGETPFDEPVQLPSGSVYEPDAPVVTATSVASAGSTSSGRRASTTTKILDTFSIIRSPSTMMETTSAIVASTISSSATIPTPPVRSNFDYWMVWLSVLQKLSAILKIELLNSQKRQ